VGRDKDTWPGKKRGTPAQLAVVGLGFFFALALWFLLFEGLLWLHWYPEAPGGIGTPSFGTTRVRASGYLLSLPALFASFGPGFLLSNLVARYVGPWRRTLDRDAERVPGGDYGSSQRGLIRFSVVLLLLAAPFVIAGVLLGR